MKRALFLPIAVFLLTSCAARLPSRAESQKVIHHFFQRYAKKYPTTTFGTHKVTKVEVIEEQEIKKNLVAVQAYLTLGGGDTIRKISATLERKATRWKFRSWENPEGS